jgi:acetyltransferase-like isoleucine patch superfamily enzyme
MREELGPFIEAGFATIGEHSYGAPKIRFAGLGHRFHCGRYCSFAPGAQVLLGGNHRPDWATTYPFPAFADRFPAAEGIEGYHVGRGDVVVGNDVWCGSSAALISGVTVGDGAVVAIGSVVTKDVPPFAIVGGNPAQLIRYRFDEETIADLLALRWWDWDDEKVNANVHLLCGDPRALIEAHRG